MRKYHALIGKRRIRTGRYGAVRRKSHERTKMLRPYARSLRNSLAALMLRNTPAVTLDGVHLSLHHPAISNQMRYVLWRGYEQRDLPLLKEMMAPDDSVLVAGASIGFLSIYCRKIIGVKRVAMVEANDARGSLLAENFRLNGLAQEPFILGAVAGHDGDIEFHTHENFWSSSILTRSATEKVSVVPAMTLPTILARLPFRPTTLIMDIEGGEAEIPGHHFDHFEKIMIELHPKLTGKEPADNLLAALEQLGFRILRAAGHSYALRRS